MTLPGAADDFNGGRFLRIQRAVEESGLAYTFLRPGGFASNAARWSIKAAPFTTISGGGGEHKCDLLLYTAVPASVAVDAIVLRWPEFGIHAESAVDARAVADARTRVHTPRWM
ncbi:hypothetical protein GCM10009862_26120 [Microbacterium binotii]|uniref:NAD(P)-binding domain-containing protein n=1 Tax=Microbacterium binotii TaxID=462710 RepID=A0ABN3PHA1_9MICO